MRQTFCGVTLTSLLSRRFLALTEEQRAVVSFASLVGNANALDDISEVLKATPHVRGEIYGLDTVIPGLATGTDGEELGRYIVIEVDLPRN